MWNSQTLIKCLLSIAAYIAPLYTMISCVLIFISLDFLTGVYAAYIQKIPIVSHRMRKTVEKFVLYSVAILTGYMFELNFAVWSNLAQIVAGFIASTELFSIYENITKITGLNFIKKIKDILYESITKLFKK